MYFTKWYRLVCLFLICLIYSVYTYYSKVKKEKQVEERRQALSTLPDETSKLESDVVPKKPGLASKDRPLHYRPLYYRVLIYGVLKPLLYSGLVYILDLWWYTMQSY